MQLIRAITAFFLTLSIAACASAQSQPQPDLSPPPKKPLDAKTQLETGRQY